MLRVIFSRLIFFIALALLIFIFFLIFIFITILRILSILINLILFHWYLNLALISKALPLFFLIWLNTSFDALICTRWLSFYRLFYNFLIFIIIIFIYHHVGFLKMLLPFMLDQFLLLFIKYISCLLVCSFDHKFVYLTSPNLVGPLGTKLKSVEFLGTSKMALSLLSFLFDLFFGFIHWVILINFFIDILRLGNLRRSGMHTFFCYDLVRSANQTFILILLIWLLIKPHFRIFRIY